MLSHHFADARKQIHSTNRMWFQRNIDHKTFGELVSKFDTAILGMPVIHADKYQVQRNEITWTLLGKTITSKIIRTEEISVGWFKRL